MSSREISEFFKKMDKMGGTIFSVGFIKRTTGEFRFMNCRLGVTKHLKGGTKKFNDAVKQLKTVYDIQNKGYRSIPEQGIVFLKGKGNMILDTHKLHALDSETRKEILSKI